MARINLLPWREEKRRERQRQFLTTLLMTAILGVLIVFLVLAGQFESFVHPLIIMLSVSRRYRHTGFSVTRWNGRQAVA